MCNGISLIRANRQLLPTQSSWVNRHGFGLEESWIAAEADNYKTQMFIIKKKKNKKQWVSQQKYSRNALRNFWGAWKGHADGEELMVDMTLETIHMEWKDFQRGNKVRNVGLICWKVAWSRWKVNSVICLGFRGQAEKQ